MPPTGLLTRNIWKLGDGNTNVKVEAGQGVMVSKRVRLAGMIVEAMLKAVPGGEMTLPPL